VRDADPVSDPTARRRVQVEGHGKNPGGIEWLTSLTERLASIGRCDTAEMFAAPVPNGGETGTAKYKSALAMPPVVGAWRESSGVQRRSDGNLNSLLGTSTPAILWLQHSRYPMVEVGEGRRPLHVGSPFPNSRYIAMPFRYGGDFCPQEGRIVRLRCPPDLKPAMYGD
jgi:hypothetical protein